MQSRLGANQVTG